MSTVRNAVGFVKINLVRSRSAAQRILAHGEEDGRENYIQEATNTGSVPAVGKDPRRS